MPTRGGISASRSAGGLTAAQSAILAMLTKSGDTLQVSGRAIEHPQSVADWTSFPAGWTKNTPSTNSSLDAGSWVEHDGSGLVMKVDHVDSYAAGPESANLDGPGQPLVFIPIDLSLDVLDVSIVLNGWTNHEDLSGSSFYFAQLLLTEGPTAELGGWAAVRAYYSDAAAGNAGSPHWYAAARHKPRNEGDQAGSSNETIQEGAGDPGNVTLRLKLTDRLNKYQAYLGATEITSGATQWRTPGTDPGDANSAPLPIYLGIGPACSASPSGDPIECTLISFTVNEVSS